MSGRRVLVVDDDRLFCSALEDALAGQGIEVCSAHSAAQARALMSTDTRAVLLDNRLQDEDGLALVPEFEKLNSEVNVILCTAYPDVQTAVAALRLRVFDYVVKPVVLPELLETIRRGLVGSTPTTGRADRHGLERICGSSSFADSLRATCSKAARAQAPVLITGETGTGKTLVAQAIHESGDGTRPFIHINCAALPDNLIEAELFGAEKGAFTGSSGRRGLFELADGGTLFLDEVAELPTAMQTKLLLALEEGWIRRVGGTKPQRLSVRFIAATNAGLEQAVESGRLRSDLYFRLNVVHISLPPLRAHLEDLPDLVSCLLAGLGETRPLGPFELQALCQYTWPGNTRELRNLLERASVLQTGEQLFPSLLLASRQEAHPFREPSYGFFPTSDDVMDGALTEASTPTNRSTPSVSLAELERRHIVSCLVECDGNRARAARLLGVSVATLRRKLTRYKNGYEGGQSPARETRSAQ